MAVSAEQIIKDVQQGRFAPIYFLCGEETYYVDKVEEAIIAHAFQPGEKDFNFDVLYSKDVDSVKDVVNACQVYPAFANRRVVVFREAQQFNKVEQWKALESYLVQPTETTVLIVCHKHKTPDKRTAMFKLLSKHAVLLISEKLKEQQVPGWIEQYVKGKGFQISKECALLLAENLGSDISRIANEVEKLELALPKGGHVSQEVIEQYIGISRDYNNLELLNAIQDHNVVKAVKILKYYENNPKAGPPPLIIGTLYSFFIKMWQYSELNEAQRRNDAEVARAVGIAPFMVSRYKAAARHYPKQKTEQAIELLSEYDARSKGINSHMTKDYELMTELVYKLMH